MARAISRTVTGRPLATLSVPSYATGAARASTLARATCVHVDEVAGLASRPRTPPVAGRLRGGSGTGRDPGVGRVAGHPRSVDVVVAQGGDGDAVRVPKAEQRCSWWSLVAGVHVAGIGRRVLAGGLPRHRSATAGTPGLEPAGLEVVHGTGGGSDTTVAGAAVGNLAVHHHAAGQHQASREAGVVQGPQHGGRTGVVVVDVVTHVGEADTEPDPRRLVAHGVDTGDSACPASCPDRGCRHRYSARIRQAVGDAGMRGRVERVQHHDLVTGVEQLLDDAER